MESDNGPKFSSAEFKKFVIERKFNRTICSPYHPHENGLAEIAAQKVKDILTKPSNNDSDVNLGLLNYMNTPRGNLGSPAQRLFGHNIHRILPVQKNQLLTSLNKDGTQTLQSERRPKIQLNHLQSKLIRPSLQRITPTNLGNQHLFTTKLTTGLT